MSKSRKQKSVFVSYWIAPFTVAILSGVVVWALPDEGRHGIWSFINGFIQIILGLFSSIGSLLALEVPIWVVLIVVLAAIAASIIIIRLFSPFLNMPSPMFRDEYLGDVYRTWRYKWIVEHGTMYNFRAVCFACNCEVIKKLHHRPFHRSVIICPNCGREDLAPSSLDNEAAEKVFVHRYNSGEWKNRSAEQ